MKKSILFVLLALFSIAHAQLKLLSSYPTALCLDGSPGGFYYRINSTVKNWIIYHEGGGECLDFPSCLDRSLTNLGSSKKWGTTFRFAGMLSSNVTMNKYLASWNVLQIQYCDGQSFLGDASATSNNKTLHFRGQAILRAVLSELEANFGLGQAQQVVITGSSAGGIATYNHVDWWKSSLPAGAKVVGVPDAGWFVDVNGNKKRQTESLSDFFKVCNCSAGVDASCLQHYGVNNAVACFGSANVYPFVTAPLFIVQSRFDQWQAVNTLGLTCTPPACSAADMQTLNNHGQLQYSSMSRSGVFNTTKDSVFMDSCFIHVQVTSDSYWSAVQINGDSMGAAFNKFLSGGQRVQDVNNCDFNCNPTCP